MILTQVGIRAGCIQQPRTLGEMIPRSVVSEDKYWQPCMFKLKVHTYQVIQSIKQLIFLGNTTLCQEEDVGVVLRESFQQFPSVLQYLREMST